MSTTPTAFFTLNHHRPNMANTTAGNVIKKRPHTYNSTERAALSTGIDDMLDAKDALEREKKSANADFKARGEEIEEKLQILRLNKRQGYEVREHECAVIREIATKTVNYVDVKSGEIISQEPFTKDDWDIVMGQSQLGMFNVDAPDENEIRGRVLHPNYDDEGNPIAGPDTDRYNNTYPSSPYKHLSPPKDVDFAPALPSTDVADFIATLSEEARAKYHEIIASFEHYTVAELETCVAAYKNPPVELAEGSDEQKVQAIIIDNLNKRILALLRDEDGDAPTDNGVQSEKPVLYPNHNELGETIPGPETDLYNEALTVAQENDETITARLDAMSQEEIKAKLAQYDQYDQDGHSAVSFYAAALRGAIVPSDAEQNRAADDGPEADDDSDDDQDGAEPTEGDDKPQKPKPTPKRPANRKK